MKKFESIFSPTKTKKEQTRELRELGVMSYQLFPFELKWFYPNLCERLGGCSMHISLGGTFVRHTLYIIAFFGIWQEVSKSKPTINKNRNKNKK
jgi:hypothetical protein